MTPNALEHFRTVMPNCELALLADISAGTILASDSAIKQGQEHLDALCKAACAFLGGQTDGSPSSVIEARPTGIRLFVMSHDDPDEALCALFAPGTDLKGVLQAAHECLSAPANNRIEA